MIGGDDVELHTPAAASDVVECDLVESGEAWVEGRGTEAAGGASMKLP